MSQNQDDHTAEQATDDTELSKSELKRRMLALQVLGEQLVGLSEQQLKQVPMPEKLADSVHRARSITKRGGRRRELQYIGKVMRSIDITEIQEALDRLQHQGVADKQQFHLLEDWRARLLSSKEGITDFVAAYPDANVQLLRQLTRNYSSAKNEAQKTKAYRALFKLVRDTIQN